MPAAKEAGPTTALRRRLRVALRAGMICVAGGLALCVLCLWWPSPPAPLPEAANSRLIVNARIIDVRLGSAGSPTHVLVEAGRIVQ